MKKVDLKTLSSSLSKFLSNIKGSNRKMIMIRSAESQGNLSGTLTGWMDVRLSDYGRKQAFTLNPELEKHMVNINSYHSSDL